MNRSSIWGVAAAAVTALAVAGGCEQRLAMQPARDHDAVEAETAQAFAPAPAERADERLAPRERTQERRERASVPVRLIAGRPMWADNRKHTAVENAQYQFERHGPELGARDLDDFLGKAHRFANSPPEGVLTMTRANGDRLMFDPKSKLFAVVRSDGAPRTVFRPETGRAYWDEQVAANGSSRRTASSRDRREDDRSRSGQGGG